MCVQGQEYWQKRLSEADAVLREREKHLSTLQAAELLDRAYRFEMWKQVPDCDRVRVCVCVCGVFACGCCV